MQPIYDLERYNRHLLIPGFEEEHQIKLKKASVLVVGAGGLGSPNLLYLTAAGVGSIGIVDDDKVSLSNLQRQVLYDESMLGKSKAEAAASKLKMLSSYTAFDVYSHRLDESNSSKLFEGFDIIVDGTDNFETRYIIDDYCRKEHIPYVYGSISEFGGQLSVFNYGDAPSYRDVFPEATTETKRIGVLGALPGIIGSMQALECIKIITGLGEPLAGTLCLYDGKKGRFEYVDL